MLEFVEREVVLATLRGSNPEWSLSMTRRSLSLKLSSLDVFLDDIRSYLHEPDSWAGDRTSLLAPRDSHVLVSAQAAFLPIPRQGIAEFNPVLFNYQSYQGDPAVLTILATAITPARNAAARGARDADMVGITGCFCAVAETGTLMLLSGVDTPGSVSLLPETHVAVLAASRIVAGMEEAWNLARTELGVLPRAVNFVSGPSRTGDIEQTIVLGAHGPYRVHLVIVED